MIAPLSTYIADAKAFVSYECRSGASVEYPPCRTALGEISRAIAVVLDRLLDLDMAAGKQLKHRPVECRQIAGLLAGYPVAVHDDLLVHPVAAGIADVVLDGVVTC